jgi:chromosome segregation ATPase
MSFITSLFKKHAENVFNDVQEFIVTLDPETATEAQIEEFNKKLAQASEELAKSRLDYQKEQKEADVIVALYNQRLKAAEILQNKFNAAATDTEKATLETSLGSLLTMIEGMTADVEREKQEAEDAKAIMDDLLKFVEESAATLKQARQRLQHSQNEMKRAELEQKRAQQRVERAEVLAGIKKEGDSFNVALTAMEKKTREAKVQADGANTRASLLKPTDKEKGDDNIKAALAEAEGKPVAGGLSVAERLAALQKK